MLSGLPELSHICHITYKPDLSKLNIHINSILSVKHTDTSLLGINDLKLPGHIFSDLLLPVYILDQIYTLPLEFEII